MRKRILKAGLLGTAGAACMANLAFASSFNIPAGDMDHALQAYMAQSGVQLFVSDDVVKGLHTGGVKGDLSADDALSHLLSGTGLTSHRDKGAVAIVRRGQSSDASDIRLQPMQLAQAAPARAAVETVTVTSSKLGGADVQSIPIAITALSQEQLTATQTAGGPDLVKQVPNLTFTKTNFSGYSINIRGIGTQAISVTTDPAVAVALNDTPFIRNHFFEQEFYDLGQLEVLRGPQGTLYGRNATAGVVNLVTAKPTDQFEAMASGELGNYHQRRFEGMINIPLVDDRLDLRLAGEWTKRQGYSFNSLTGQRIDGRDLWSGRVTIGWKPIQNLQAYFVWEHFSEDDDRMRSAKQLCKTAPTPTQVGGRQINPTGGYAGEATYLSQGCEAASLYSPESFEVPNGISLPYFGPLAGVSAGGAFGNASSINPYASTTQSSNLRVIESQIDPIYQVKNDVIELNTDYAITPVLTLTSQSSFNHDFLWSTEDYNRFNSTPGIFRPTIRNGGVLVDSNGVFCDPQIGCSNRLVAQDLVKANSWQFSQEFRFTSNFEGPFNFSAGGNYLHYETHENYYVFINSLSILAAQGVSGVPAQNTPPYVPNVSDNHECMFWGKPPGQPQYVGYLLNCIYMDPNPLKSVNDKGHNYFLSQNPYVLNSYAGFGEANYSPLKDVKLTGGVRWTEDRKHAPQIPSWLVVANTYGYPVAGNVNQQWDKITGRFVANWTPQLGFTDQTSIYGSYAKGYKAGGANPPPTVIVGIGTTGPAASNPTSIIHPATFDPETLDAFEVGTKNTLFDGALTLNGDVFYYNYVGYQISEIVDRTSVNLNFDAHVKGAELEATYEPVPGLKFNLGTGYEDARLARGSKAIDLMDRTAGNPDFMVVKSFATNPSNCIVPVARVAAHASTGECQDTYSAANVAQHIALGGGYYTDDPLINGGAGIFKDLSGNEMPNAPPWTVSFGAQYSLPVTTNWAATLRGDFYYQSNSYWRIFNDLSYDELHGYKTFNLTLILTNQAGWQVMLYDKNVFNTTAITGAFLNSDDSGLTTNVFLTDPKLIGIRVTKNW